LTSPTSAAQPDAEATFALLYKAIARTPDNVDAMIGLAGTHLRVGQLAEALDWCARASAIEHSPRIDRLRLAVDDALVKRALHEVIDARMAAAIQTLARSAEMAGGTARRYRELLLTASAWFEDATHLGPETEAIRLSLPVWGADYVSAASSGLLASLLAPGNLPALARRKAVRIEITTTATGQAMLEAEPVMAAVRRLAAVDYFTIPDSIASPPPRPDFSYWVMSAAHYASIERARRARSAISFLTADMLLSDGSLGAAQRLLDGGMKAVLVSALEVDRMAVAPDSRRSGEPLSLAGSDLVDHGLAGLGLHATEPLPDGCRVLTPSSFAVKGGYAAYKFHFLPLMIAAELASREFACDLLTVDTRTVRLALGDAEPEGRVKIVTDPSEIAIASTLAASRGDRKSEAPNSDALGRWAASWCFAPADIRYFEWCFRHRIVYPFSGATIDPRPCEAESAAVASALAAFRHHAAGRFGAN
jgi:hypothetical protein